MLAFDASCDVANVTECPSSGLLVDLTQALAERYNFTLVSERQADGDWGYPDTTSTFTLNMSWTGVTGGVVLGRYATSLSTWVWTNYDHPVMDHVIVVSETEGLAFTPQQQELDGTLFTRQFNYQVRGTFHLKHNFNAINCP